MAAGQAEDPMGAVASDVVGGPVADLEVGQVQDHLVQCCWS